MTNVTEVVQAADWAGRVKRSKSEQLHDKFAFDVRVRKLPDPATELRFAKVMKRQWRFDFAWPHLMLAVEIEGLVVEEVVVKRTGRTRWVLMGGHATPDGFKDDIEKYNAALLLGWSVLRFHQAQITGSEAIDTTVRALYAKGWQP